MARYEKPDWLTKHVFNPVVSLLTNLGVSVRGSRILVVRGRKSGQAAPSGSTPLLTDSSAPGASADPLAPVKKVTDDAARRASFRPFDRLKNWRYALAVGGDLWSVS